MTENQPVFIGNIDYYRITVESPKWGSLVGYSKSQDNLNYKGEILTLLDSPSGLNTFSVRWSDVITLRSEAVFVAAVNGDDKPPLHPVCRHRYKGKKVGELIELTVKSINAFLETGDSRRHREEIAIISQEMKISHSLKRY